MALVNVESKLVDGRWQSNPISVTGKSIAFQIDMAQRGDVMVEMSVDGTSYASNNFVQAGEGKTCVGIISNAVAGMYLRFQFYGTAKPEKISIIQSN